MVQRGGVLGPLRQHAQPAVRHRERGRWVQGRPAACARRHRQPSDQHAARQLAARLDLHQDLEGGHRRHQIRQILRGRGHPQGLQQNDDDVLHERRAACHTRLLQQREAQRARPQGHRTGRRRNLRADQRDVRQNTHGHRTRHRLVDARFAQQTGGAEPAEGLQREHRRAGGHTQRKRRHIARVRRPDRLRPDTAQQLAAAHRAGRRHRTRRRGQDGRRQKSGE